MEHEENKALELPKPGETIEDAETGMQLQVTREALAELLTAEAQISAGLHIIASALKGIRDKKLFLFRGCTNMREYTARHVAYSHRQAERLLSLADRFSDSEHYADIASLPQRFLDEIKKDAAKADRLAKGEFLDDEGNVFTIDELREMTSAELLNKVRVLEKEKSKLAGESKSYRQQAEQFKKLADDLEEMQGVSGKSIRLKTEIVSAISVAGAGFAKGISDLTAIETDDPELIGQLASAVSGAIAALSALQDRYMPYLMAAAEND